MGLKIAFLYPLSFYFILSCLVLFCHIWYYSCLSSVKKLDCLLHLFLGLYVFIKISWLDVYLLHFTSKTTKSEFSYQSCSLSFFLMHLFIWVIFIFPFFFLNNFLSLFKLLFKKIFLDYHFSNFNVHVNHDYFHSSIMRKYGVINFCTRASSSVTLTHRIGHLCWIVLFPGLW